MSNFNFDFSDAATRVALLHGIEILALSVIWANAKEVLPQAALDRVQALGEVDWFDPGSDGSSARLRASYALWAEWNQADGGLEAAHEAVMARPYSTRRWALERLLCAKMAFRRDDHPYALAAATEAAGRVASLRGRDAVGRSEASAAAEHGFALSLSNDVERIKGTWVGAQGASL